MINDAYIVEALRTPVTKAPRGHFKNVRPDDLLIHCMKGIQNKYQNFDFANIEDVIIGCAMPEGEQGMNVARNALLLAGIPNTVPGITINRFCCSGIQSVAMAAHALNPSQPMAFLAGGVESMSMVPMGGHKLSPNPSIFTNEHIGIAYGMGLTAEIVAKRYEISTEAQLEFSLKSHQKAIKAIEFGYFDNEILPLHLKKQTASLSQHTLEQSEITITHDEGPRAQLSLEKMAKLKSPFSAKSGVTAATSSQMSDGAGIALIANEALLKAQNLTPKAKLLSYAVCGLEPEIMGVGPIKAIPKALKEANLSIDDIDWIELNEAFAAQSLAVIKALNLNMDKINPQGGAIALGHPLGATGAIRLATAINGLQRTKGRYGMITMCIGTGMGACAIIENMV